MAVTTSISSQTEGDKKPLFNGKPAEEGFREYVAQNAYYPAKAMENGISGRVFVEFLALLIKYT